MEVEELSNKKTQADYIKSQQIIAEEKRRAIELEKKNRIKEELERKIAEEEERIQLAEGNKQHLEQEEIEILKVEHIRATYEYSRNIYTMQLLEKTHKQDIELMKK